MPLSYAEAFGIAVRELRKERGMTQEEVALVSDIDRAYFGRLERAMKVPTLTTVSRIAVALQTSPSELLLRTEQILEEVESES